MKHYLTAAILILCLFSCTNKHFEQDKKAIITIMDTQAKCWSNGDIEGFMDGYWKSDSLRFLGRRGLTKGWQTTLNNYKKFYPDRQTMGTLKFNYISFEQMNDKNMFVVGKWTLEREKDSLSGYYSLLWGKIDGQWKVIFDHTN
jgi:ketosteroid isomerase-like protein